MRGSRCRPAAADADHLAPADHRPALAQLRRAGGQRRLGCRAHLAALCEHELAERTHPTHCTAPGPIRSPQGKTFATFEFTAVPTLRKAHVLAFGAGDAWLDQGANVLLFGPSGSGKSHVAAAIGHALIDTGRRVLFTRTTDLVQLQAARRDLALPATLAKLDRYD